MYSVILLMFIFGNDLDDRLPPVELNFQKVERPNIQRDSMQMIKPKSIVFDDFEKVDTAKIKKTEKPNPDLFIMF
jgi:hypothetical protein